MIPKAESDKPAVSDVELADRRARTAEAEGWISAGLSLLLASVKFVMAGLSGSVSLLADALNNLADIASSMVIAIGCRIARKPRDREHPFGHGRMETVSGLVLAILLMIVGLECVKEGVWRWIRPEPIDVAPWMIPVLAGTIALKILMSALAFVLAKRTGSTVLRTDGWNHAFDVASTALVIAAIAASERHWPAVDGIAGIAIGCAIFAVGLRSAKDTVDALMGRSPDADLLGRIRQAAERETEVRGIHGIVAHDYGRMKVITLHIEVDAGLSALACHDLTERVEDAVTAETGCKAVVHSDPVDRSHPDYERVERALFDWIERSSSAVADAHDLRLYGDAPGLRMETDLVVQCDVPVQRFDEHLEAAAGELFDRMPDVQTLDLGIEHEVAGDPEYRRRFGRPSV
jgi:cation diffusion facilitator family transporter